MLALFGNLDILEIVVIFAVAIMVFGKDLPQVAMRGAAQLMKLRREVTRMWREAGLEEELRKVRRDIEQEVPHKLPRVEELIQEAEHERRVRESRGPTAETIGGLTPIDPLSREALSNEPRVEPEPEPTEAAAHLEPRLEPPGGDEEADRRPEVSTGAQAPGPLEASETPESIQAESGDSQEDESELDGPDAPEKESA